MFPCQLLTRLSAGFMVTLISGRHIKEQKISRQVSREVNHDFDQLDYKLVGIHLTNAAVAVRVLAAS
jgi:hypothetical protein